MKEETIKDIERINFLFLCLGSLFVLVLTRDFGNFLSYSLASGIMVLNFRLLKNIVARGFSSSRVSKKKLFFGLLAKFLGLLVVVGLILRSKEIDFMYFVLGLSSFFFSVILSQFSPRFGNLQGGGSDGT